MPQEHVSKNIFLNPWAPQCPKVRPLGYDQGDRMKIPFELFCIFYLYNTHKIWYKIFEIDMLTEI